MGTFMIHMTASILLTVAVASRNICAASSETAECRGISEKCMDTFKFPGYLDLCNV